MKACVLSGGGAKGVFQAGILRTLLDSNPDLDYDIFAGISVGALNAAKLSEGPLNKTLPELEEIWLEKVKGNGSVWNHHLWRYILLSIIIILLFMAAGFISFILTAPKWLTIIFAILTLASFYIPYHVLMHTHSIYTTEPLQKLIEKNINLDNIRTSGKKLFVGAVSFTSGNVKIVDESVENLVDWIIASSAFPVFFPPVLINGEYWTDGGLTDITPLSTVIKAGATEIDVILASPINTGYFNGLPGILKQLLRNIDIMSTEILRNDLEVNCKVYEKDVKIRIFKPDTQLTSNSLNFDPERLHRMYNEGKRIAREAIY